MLLEITTNVHYSEHNFFPRFFVIKDPGLANILAYFFLTQFWRTVFLSVREYSAKYAQSIPKTEDQEPSCVWKQILCDFWFFAVLFLCKWKYGSINLSLSTYHNLKNL